MAKIDYKIVDAKTLELKTDAKAGDIIDLSKSVEIDLEQINDKIKEKAIIEGKKIAEKDFKLELSDKMREVEQEYNQKIVKLQKINTELKTELQQADKNKNMEIENKISKTSEQLSNTISKKENEINLLKSKMEHIENTKNIEIDSIKNQLSLKFKEKEEKLKSELGVAKKEIDLLNDMKLALSTKMLGETLEQHCEIKFDTEGKFMFVNATFEKDNDISTGSKGDYIYRECDDNDIEVLSIMFEMKNESDTTTTKKKNKDFYRELDKDRNEKKCEYAVLVSLLEKDDERFDGIYVVNVKEYEKMFVVRPKDFLSIIQMLRLGNTKSMEYKNEIVSLKNRNIDLENFESNLNNFKDDFGRNFNIAKEKYGDAIEQIDKSIAALNKTKDFLLGSQNQLGIANRKVEEVSIKKLTKNAPSISEAIKTAGNK
ncbi:MAG: DUF2130 domain-containing protein [Endomicrobium sp.]|jgi:hypothetical protein|nr:DUF2130 domain-containing protein [Endomicrobium sp.]